MFASVQLKMFGVKRKCPALLTVLYHRGRININITPKAAALNYALKLLVMVDGIPIEKTDFSCAEAG